MVKLYKNGKEELIDSRYVVRMMMRGWDFFAGLRDEADKKWLESKKK